MICLDRNKWTLGARLGRGGFGQVYEATADDGREAVAKMVPLGPGVTRDLLVEDLSGVPNVIPVIDSGTTNSHLVIVMPRAEKSLREHIDQQAGRLSVRDVVGILSDIAETLAAMEGKAVHRDLKPENVLYWEGHWCLTDFGIARVANADTATHTWKDFMTAQYAAPEQWRSEHATSATDVYALGVIAFELLEGRWPFMGPTRPDFRQQHLTESPPELQHGTPQLQNLVIDCLTKAPGGRPSAQNVLKRLATATSQASPAGNRLQQANLEVAVKQAREAAEESRRRLGNERRDGLYRAAEQAFARVMGGLRDRLDSHAPNAEIQGGKAGLQVELGGGAMRCRNVSSVAPSDRMPFDVVASSVIEVQMSQPRYGYHGRQHGLWYCDSQVKGEYRWYEIAFMITPGVRAPARTMTPFALSAEDHNAAMALLSGMHTFQVAYPFTAIDQGRQRDFIERWLSWFAEAVQGSLARPRSMPEKNVGSWRKTPET